jgi:hypothetical protein
LRVSATAENISKHPLEDMFGDCYRLNRLSVIARTGSRAWDSQKWEIARLPVYHDSAGRVIEMACGGVAFVTLLPPGGLVHYELRVPVKQILGDSLSPGTYRITARIVTNGQEVKNVPAGYVNLNPPPA